MCTSTKKGSIKEYICDKEQGHTGAHHATWTELEKRINNKIPYMETVKYDTWW